MRAADLFMRLIDTGNEEGFWIGGMATHDSAARQHISKAEILKEDNLIELDECFANGCEYSIKGRFTILGKEERKRVKGF